MERLLETLVEKISAYEEEENSQKIMTPESMSNDILTPSMTNISGASVQDNAPFLSLFDNSVVSIYSQNIPIFAHSYRLDVERTISLRPPRLPHRQLAPR